MDKITNYLDNLFFGMPRTEEVGRMKQNILLHMQERYSDLCAQGKNEDEAFGIVAGEFGSMEELKKELGLQEESSSMEPNLDLEWERECTAFYKKFSIAITTGVGLCIFGASMQHFLSERMGTATANSVFLLFVLVAVCCFVYFGIMKSRYDKREREGKRTGQIDFEKKGPSKLGAICGIIMLSCLILFLLFGFILGAWYPAWIVFPVGGILCGIVSIIMSVR